MKTKTTAATRSLAAHKANWTRRIARLVRDHKIKFSVLATEVTGGGLREVEFNRIVTLPFVPTRGAMLCVVDGDDFREVDRVYWDGSESVPFTIWFTNRFVRADTLRQLGWKENKEGGPF